MSSVKCVSKPTPDVKNGITQKLQASKQAKQGEVCRHTTLETLKGQYLKQTISVSIINRLKKLYSVQYSCYIGCTMLFRNTIRNKRRFQCNILIIIKQFDFSSQRIKVILFYCFFLWKLCYKGIHGWGESLSCLICSLQLDIGIIIVIILYSSHPYTQGKHSRGGSFRQLSSASVSQCRENTTEAAALDNCRV